MNVDPNKASKGAVDVVHVNSRLNVGGIARYVAWLASGLRDKGHSTLLVAGTVSPGEDDMSGFVEKEGVPLLTLPEMGREISPQDLVTVWKLYRLLCQVRPSIVHTHAAKAGATGRIAAWLYRWLTPGTLFGRPRRCSVVHTFHGHVFHSYYGPWKTRLFVWIERFLARLATDRIVVLGPQQFQEIHGKFGIGKTDQLAVIPLGIDLDTYHDWPKRRSMLRKELGAESQDILVGIVGRLTEIKNHRLFLETAARFRSVHGASGLPRVRFVVIGDGHLRANLEEQARGLDISSDVAFLGMRNDPESFYPALDIVALTSLNEGTPLALIEAMANARPVLSTQVGGVVDVVGQVEQVSASGDYSVCERGILARSGDSTGLCAGLAHLVRNAALRRTLGERGPGFVRSHYSKDRLIDDMADLYATLLRRDCSAPETISADLAPRTITSKGNES
jgi:glycosyltransferase involved in cell wall biosynthesis